MTFDDQLNNIDVCLEPFGTFYVPNFHLLMQLFVSVISGTVVTFDGQLNHIDVCLEPFGIFYVPNLSFCNATIC